MENQGTDVGRSARTKARIFDHYSKDLSTVLSQWKMKIRKPGSKDTAVYLCPISLKIFGKSSLINQELTLEHVPPRSLGGKGLVLTAKDINSKDGSGNDKSMLQHIETRYFIEGQGALPISLSSAKYGIKGLKMDFSMDKRNKLFNFSAPGNNIAVLDKMGVFENWDGIELKISGKAFHKPNKFALLKCAYLLAFHRLRYQLILGPKLLINPAFRKIANVLSGDTTIDVPIVGLRDKFAPISQGILGIVASPVEYQCLVVNFSVGIKGKSQYNYSAFLPHPLDENFENLSKLRKAFESKIKFNLQIESLEEHLKHYRGELPVLWYHSLWQSVFDRAVS